MTEIQGKSILVLFSASFELARVRVTVDCTLRSLESTQETRVATGFHVNPSDGFIVLKCLISKQQN